MQALKKRAKDSVNVVRNKEVKKEGVVASLSEKMSDKKAARVVGVSKGATVNMGDYESLRIDIWLSDYVQENETPQQAFGRVSAIVTELFTKELEKAYDEAEPKR